MSQNTIENNRVYLVSPNYMQVYGDFQKIATEMFFNPPIGLMYVESSLEVAGLDVRIADATPEGLTVKNTVVIKKRITHKINFESRVVRLSKAVIKDNNSLKSRLQPVF